MTLHPALRQEALDAPLAGLRPHPRLIANDDDFERLLKLQDSEPFRSGFATVQQAAQDLLDQPPLVYEIADGKRLLFVSRRVLDRVYRLAFMARFEPDQACWRDRLWDEVDAVCGFPDWNPAHFLDTAEMAHAVAVAYDWLHDRWSDDQLQTMQRVLMSHALEQGLMRYRDDPDTPRFWFGWHINHNNWNVVCNGGLAIAALALAEAEPDTAECVVDHAVRYMPICLQHFAPDGAWIEGVGYWAYTHAYLTATLASFQTALGHDFGLSDLPGIENTTLFPHHLTGPTGLPFNFSDMERPSVQAVRRSKPRSRHSDTVHYFAQHYENTSVRAVAGDMPRDSPSALLWSARLSDTDYPDPADLPRDAYFRGAEVVALRSAWNDHDALFLSAQCGRNSVGHNQADLGGFVFDALGQRCVAPAPEDRGRPDRDRARAAEGHLADPA